MEKGICMEKKPGMKKRICFIATGGTIACSDSGNGLMPSLGAEGLAAAVPEAGELCSIDFVQLMQLDSSNLTPAHWQGIAGAVADRHDAYDGFVISHGTDTMAYTAAALYYMLENVNVPVVLTGSQLPMEHPETDAKRNLLTAFHAAASGRAGVFLAFDGHVLFGDSAKKLYSKDFHAFHSINRPEAGELDFAAGKMVWHQPDCPPAGSFRLHRQLDDRVMVLKLLPGTSPELLRLAVDAGYRGIILESFGAGGVPTDESPLSLLPMVDYAISKGVVLVCTTQCIYDGVHLETYEVGVRAMQHGVISGGTATVEALAVKLMLALGEGRDLT